MVQLYGVVEAQVRGEMSLDCHRPFFTRKRPEFLKDAVNKQGSKEVLEGSAHISFASLLPSSYLSVRRAMERHGRGEKVACSCSPPDPSKLPIPCLTRAQNCRG